MAPVKRLAIEAYILAKPADLDKPLVAVVWRSLMAPGMAVRTNFETQWASSTDVLKGLAQNLLGVASYLASTAIANCVQLVLTEPGQKKCITTCNTNPYIE
jgi:hypothetical protein